MRYIALCLVVASAGFSAPTPVKAADEEMTRLVTALCDFTKENDRSNLRKKLTQAHIRLRQIYGGFYCEGLSLYRLAVKYNANEAAEYIAGQLGAEGLSVPERDGKTCVDWVKEQIAADASKQQFLDIINSAKDDG